MAKSRATEGKTLKLGKDLRIATAGPTFVALKKAASVGDARVSLDAGQVEKVDAAGLQALLAGRAVLLRAGKAVTWSGASPQLAAAATLLGLCESLELPK